MATTNGVDPGRGAAKPVDHAGSGTPSINEALPYAKKKALVFVKRMLLNRGCSNRFQEQYLSGEKLLQMFTDDPNGNRVMAVFAHNKIVDDTLSISDFTFGETQQEEAFRGSESKTAGKSNRQSASSKNAKKAKTDTEFVKSILMYIEKHHVKTVILVSDEVTPCALKIIANHSNVTRFTYAETCIENMADHVFQPREFRALTPSEVKAFKAQKRYANWAEELPQYPVNDPLVKYYGHQVGDILSISDADGQSGEVHDFGLVVPSPGG